LAAQDDEGLFRAAVGGSPSLADVVRMVHPRPATSGQVYVFPDVSGSMRSPVTGHRHGATSSVQCVDVAALVAAALLRRNPGTQVLPFSDDVVPCQLNPRDSVLTNAEVLAGLPSGGTNCSAPLRELNARRAKAGLVVHVSDNQSWVDTVVKTGAPTATLQEWAEFRRRNPRAVMVCIDIQPYADVQAKPGTDVLHVAGFGDPVFGLIAAVSQGGAQPDWWVRQIQGVQLDAANAA